MENITKNTTVALRWKNESFQDLKPQDEIIIYSYFYQRVVLGGLFILIAILGIFGNIFVIAAVALSKRLRTKTNVFVVNLAVSDLLTCLVMPWQALAIIGGGSGLMEEHPWVCTATSFVTLLTISCSINNLALIAVNRWVGITKSRYTTRRIYTARKLGLMVVLAWAIPMGCAMTPVLTDFGQLGYEKLYSTCTWVRSNSYSFSYNVLVSTVSYPVQLTLIVFCYASILRCVHKTSRRMSRAGVPTISSNLSSRGGGPHNKALKKMMWTRELRVTMNLMYVVLAYLACLTPYVISIVFRTPWSKRMVPWAAVVLFSNSCVNSIIYGTSHPDFKKVFSYMIRCKKIPNRF